MSIFDIGLKPDAIDIFIAYYIVVAYFAINELEKFRTVAYFTTVQKNK